MNTISERCPNVGSMPLSISVTWETNVFICMSRRKLREGNVRISGEGFVGMVSTLESWREGLEKVIERLADRFPIKSYMMEIRTIPNERSRRTYLVLTEKLTLYPLLSQVLTV